MDEGTRSDILSRLRILRAYALAMENPGELVQVCSDLDPDADDDALVTAVAARFNLDEVAARAVADLQVRRLTPRRVAQVHEELADLQHRLAES